MAGSVPLHIQTAFSFVQAGSAEHWDTLAGANTHLCNGLAAAAPFPLELK